MSDAPSSLGLFCSNIFACLAHALECEVSIRRRGFAAFFLNDTAQCPEPVVWSLLRTDVCHVVMSGDPCQLPGHVHSDQARELQYDRSLVDRTMSLGHQVRRLLDTLPFVTAHASQIGRAGARDASRTSERQQHTAPRAYLRPERVLERLTRTGYVSGPLTLCAFEERKRRQRERRACAACQTRSLAVNSNRH